jgi:hypothetical protein
VLLAYDAEVTGSATPAFDTNGQRGFWHEFAPGDALTWTVRVGVAGDYDVALVAEGVPGKLRPEPRLGRDELDRASAAGSDGDTARRVEIAVGRRALDVPLGEFWDRVPVGRVRLAAGRHTIVLRIGDPAIHRFGGIEIIRPAVARELRRKADAVRADVTWMKDGVYGFMFHWLPGTAPQQGPPKPYEQAVADFDVTRFAEQMADLGAAWVTFTTTHSRHVWPGPNDAIDRVVPGRTCARDLPGDLADALGERGIRLWLYYHMGNGDREWWDRAGFTTVGRAAFLRTWCAIIRDAGRRYGERIAGWWFDDGFHTYYPFRAPWERLHRAARAGNPQRIVLFNAWNAPKVTEFVDVCSWEPWLTEEKIAACEHLPVGGDGVFPCGPQAGLHAQLTTLMHNAWGHGQIDTPIDKGRYTAPQLIRWFEAARERRAAITLNLKCYQDGSLSPRDVRIFRTVRRALRRS